MHVSGPQTQKHLGCTYCRKLHVSCNVNTTPVPGAITRGLVFSFSSWTCGIPEGSTAVHIISFEDFHCEPCSCLQPVAGCQPGSMASEDKQQMWALSWQNAVSTLDTGQLGVRDKPVLMCRISVGILVKEFHTVCVPAMQPVKKVIGHIQKKVIGHIQKLPVLATHLGRRWRSWPGIEHRRKWGCG